MEKFICLAFAFLCFASTTSFAEEQKQASVASTAIVAAVGNDIPEDREAAKRHFQKGSALYAKGDSDRALIEFEVAYQLAPEPALQYNIGICHEELGHNAAALAAYKIYLFSEQGQKDEKVHEVQAKIRALEKLIKESQDRKAHPPPSEPPQPLPPPTVVPPPQKQIFVPKLTTTLPLAAGALVAGGISATLYGLASAKLGEVNEVCIKGVPCEQRDSARTMAYASYALLGVSVAATAVSIAFGVVAAKKSSGKKNLAFGFVPTDSGFSAGVGGEF